MSESTRISAPGYDGLFHTDQLDHPYTPKVDEWCGEDSSPSYCYAWVASAEGLKMRCGRPRELHDLYLNGVHIGLRLLADAEVGGASGSASLAV